MRLNYIILYGNKNYKRTYGIKALSSFFLLFHNFFICFIYNGTVGIVKEGMKQVNLSYMIY